ncbi:MAG: hypothetical protein OXE86_03485, partial [Alphaproteobacteria bacterium]|nr:hypothetical protein [Alphaproteobacteria bacterium]
IGGTASRVEGLHVLAIQDTTSFRDDGLGNSLVGHATIAVEGEHGALLGLVDAGSLSVMAVRARARRAARFAIRKASAGSTACGPAEIWWRAAQQEYAATWSQAHRYR